MTPPDLVQLRVAAAEELKYSDIKEETIWPNTPYQKTIWTGRQPDLIGACVCEIPNCPEVSDDALQLIAIFDQRDTDVQISRVTSLEDGKRYWRVQIGGDFFKPVKSESLALAITLAALRAMGKGEEK